MIWIEFMGPAGVGKSFLYKKLLRHDANLNPEIIFLRRFFDNPSKSTFHKTLGYAFRSNIKRVFVFHKIFNNLKNKINHFDNSDNFHIETFIKGLENYDSNAINQLRLASYYYEKLKEFKLYDTYLKDNEIYLSEDGIMHLNFGEFSKDEKFIRLPDVIINIDAPDSFIIKNRMDRVRAGDGNLLEKIMTPNELKEYIKVYNSKYRRKVQQLKTLNVEVYDFNVNTENSENEFNSLLGYIKTIQK